MRRYVIIIGAMKSGTTTLFDLLAQHPQIAPASDKEPGFFAFEKIWDRGFEWFDTLFEYDPARHRYRLEASTDYTKMPFVPGIWERMTLNPDVEIKLIYIMRHPFRRLESHANHTQRKRREIGSRISPRPDHGLDAGFSQVSLAISAYAMQLDAFAVAHAAGNLHCLTLEELKNNPKAAQADICTFLGIDTPTQQPKKLEAQNASEGRTRLRSSWAQLTRLGAPVAVAKAILPATLRARIKERFREDVTAEGRFKLSPAEEHLLTALYRDDLTRLRDTYNIDTQTHWGL